MSLKTIINSQNAPAPIGPYNQAVKAGNTLYVSGQIALNPQNGEIQNKSIEEETHQVMKNLEAILKEAGVGFSNVVKCSWQSDSNGLGDTHTFPKKSGSVAPLGNGTFAWYIERPKVAATSVRVGA